MRRIDSVGIAYALWLGVAAGFLVPYAALLDGLADPTGNILGRDFINMWTGARAVAEGRVADLFEPRAFLAYQQSLFGPGLPHHNWSYPPHLLLLIAPLALLPYPAALALWSALGVLVHTLTAKTRAASAAELAVLLLAPAAIINLVTGQNGFFTAALIWLGLNSLDTRPLVAGVAFGLLTLKPQLGLLVPLVLLIDRRWRVIGAAFATFALTASLSVLLFGVESWTAYLGQALPYQTRVFTEMHGIFVAMMPTAFMNARLAGFGTETAALLQIPFSLAGTALALWGWWRSKDPVLRAGALLTGTFLVSPYLFVYDLVCFTPLLIALWGRVGDWGSRALIGLVWSLPATAIAAGLSGVPLSSLPILAFAFLVARLIAAEAKPRLARSPQNPG